MPQVSQWLLMPVGYCAVSAVMVQEIMGGLWLLVDSFAMRSGSLRVGSIANLPAPGIREITYTVRTGSTEVVHPSRKCPAVNMDALLASTSPFLLRHDKRERPRSCSTVGNSPSSDLVHMG